MNAFPSIFIPALILCRTLERFCSEPGFPILSALIIFPSIRRGGSGFSLLTNASPNIGVWFYSAKTFIVVVASCSLLQVIVILMSLFIFDVLFLETLIRQKGLNI